MNLFQFPLCPGSRGSLGSLILLCGKPSMRGIQYELINHMETALI